MIVSMIPVHFPTPPGRSSVGDIDSLRTRAQGGLIPEGNRSSVSLLPIFGTSNGRMCSQHSRDKRASTHMISALGLLLYYGPQLCFGAETLSLSADRGEEQPSEYIDVWGKIIRTSS